MAGGDLRGLTSPPMKMIVFVRYTANNLSSRTVRSGPGAPRAAGPTRGKGRT